MTIESATHISQLNSALPGDGDEIPEGDNQIRLIKEVLLTDLGSLGPNPLTVTAAQVNSVTDRVLRAGDTYTGTHNLSGATSVTVPTISAGDSSQKAVNTIAMNAAIAAVNAQTGIVASYNATAAFAVTDGQVIAGTNASASAADLSAASWAVGAIRGVVWGNSRFDNTINLGAYTVQGWNGSTITGTLTCDQQVPVVFRNFGDYVRPV